MKLLSDDGPWNKIFSEVHKNSKKGQIKLTVKGILKGYKDWGALLLILSAFVFDFYVILVGV